MLKYVEYDSIKYYRYPFTELPSLTTVALSASPAGWRGRS